MPRLAMLCSQIRTEEKLLLAACEKRSIEVDILDDRRMVWPATAHGISPQPQYDVILIRAISHSRALSALRHYHRIGQPSVNTLEVAEICGDKLRTTQSLSQAGVPSPTTHVAYTPTAALAAADLIGYPVVLKPVAGSWGRMLSKVNDRAAAEAVLEHEWVRGEDAQPLFYLQRYIDKPQRDIRAFVIGGQTIAAVYRHAEKWITNTARGGETRNCLITPELDELCCRAAHAVGGGVLAVDLLEDGEQGLLVNEINDIMEFRNSVAPTGVDIPGRVIDFALRVATDGWSAANGV